MIHVLHSEKGVKDDPESSDLETRSAFRYGNRRFQDNRLFFSIWEPFPKLQTFLGGYE